jgi:hypothetical protein
MAFPKGLNWSGFSLSQAVIAVAWVDVGKCLAVHCKENLTRSFALGVRT